MVLCSSTDVFPFYWTLAMHLLPFMNTVSQFVTPLLWEAFCVIIAAMFYLRLTSRQIIKFFTETVMLIFIVAAFSICLKNRQEKPSIKPGLECTIIQGGYSRKDYALIERHEALAVKMSQKYLEHIKEIKNKRFIVLPESVFPLWQTEEGEIIQSIKDIAKVRNEYILSGMIIEEGENVYNSTVLINPDGVLEDIYRKRNTVLFVETSKFARGIFSNTFLADGYIIAPIICFDSIFMRSYIREKRPDLYIVTSNDIFAERTILSRLHQAYGVINARTMGIPLLQVSHCQKIT
jgi:apolipoprotein N-acyltransferase